MYKNGLIHRGSDELFWRKDGTFIPIEYISTPILEGDEIRGAVVVFTNITERKKAEKVIRESEERYKRMVDAITSYTYSVEVREGEIIHSRHSMGCLSVTGYTPEDYESEPQLLYSIIHRDDMAMVENSIKEIFLGHEVPTLEHRLIKRDGSIIWVRNSMIPFFNDQGQLIRYDGLIEDITERKKLEAQLLQAQKMEAMGTLAGGIAHDFNNILTAIISYGNILLMKMKRDEPLRNYIERILNSSEKATSLVQSLLAFSRKQITILKPLDVNAVIKNIESLLSRIIGEDITLRISLAVGDLTAMADSSQMEQILMNLATNARDAMPEGGIFEIGTEVVEINREFTIAHGFGSPGKYALISVSDTGTGIDEKTKEKIFDPFFTTKEVGKGTGLGLAIVYGIIKQHNGYINCYSEQGRGTTFKIYLPLIKSKMEKKEDASVSFFKGGEETILVAEDDVEVRNTVTELLKEYGYKVIEAVDGKDAIDKFNDNRDKIQMLLLDVIMPKKNGKEVYEAIKKIKPDIKVIFMSGYVADIIHKKGIIEDGLDFILKPFSPSTVLTKVREVLDRR
ncbi:MAG: ATP-binding protein [Nitrospirota bacterium]